MDIDNLKDIKGLIISIIKNEFKFWKHYLGQVMDNQDSLVSGRVLVTIPELGFFSQDQAVWAAPRQGNSLNVPLKGEWVEIYFIGGDPNRPVYLHYAGEVQGQSPKSYTEIEDRVIFESPKTEEYIKYNDDDKTLSILGEDEHFVLGDTTKTELQKNIDALTQLQTDFTNWTPSPNDGGAALKTILTSGFLTKALASLTSILSEVITGK